MAIRMSGLVSGLDTDSIVKELVSASQYNIDKVKKKQTKLEWKKEAWSSMNSSIYSFYTGALSKFKSYGSYKAKKVTSSNENVATVTATNSAANGTHSLAVKQLASSAFLTSGKLEKTSSGDAITADTTLGDLGSSSYSITISSKGGKYSASSIDSSIASTDANGDITLTFDSEMKISDVISTLNKTGINANFDSSQNRIFLTSSASGEDYDFDVSGDLADALKLAGKDSGGKDIASKVNAQNAKIIYNSAEIESSTNTITVNGLTIEAKSVSEKDVNGEYKSINLGVETDIEGIYNKVKDFITEYNKLIDAMSTAYNAESASDYEPLTDDEKEAMSDSEVEKWETKIKDSLLRRDDTLRSLMSTFRTTMSGSVELDATTKALVTDGSSTNTIRYSLASFGIATSSDYTENGKLHIYGDSSDSTYSDKEDLLRKAIENDPDAVMNTLATLGQNLYNSLSEKMKSTDLSSAMTLYNDKQMDKQIKSYKEEISKLNDKLTDLENRYYSKFTAMEQAMAKLNAQASSFSGLFG